MPDLLAVVIAITGVTIPLIIVYRVDPKPEIRLTMAQTIDSAFKAYGIRQEDFVAAATDLSGTSAGPPPTMNGGDEPSQVELLLIIRTCYEAQNTYNHEQKAFRPLTSNVIKWLLENMPYHSKALEFFFNRHADRRVSAWYLIVLGTLAFACFVSFYLHYLGVPPPAWLVRPIVLAAAAMNFVTYAVLGWFVLEKSFLYSHIEAALWKLCFVAKSQINKSVITNVSDRDRTIEAQKATSAAVVQPAAAPTTPLLPAPTGGQRRPNRRARQNRRIEP